LLYRNNLSCKPPLPSGAIFKKVKVVMRIISSKESHFVNTSIPS